MKVPLAKTVFFSALTVGVLVLTGGCGTISSSPNNSQSSAKTSNQPVAKAVGLAFNPPTTIPTGKKAKAIALGQKLFNNTHQMLPQYNLDALSCSSCHINGGTDEKGLPLVGVSAQFPDYTSRDKRIINLSQRIDECFQRSGNGKPLPPNSADMAALEAYMQWISTGIPTGTKAPWIGNGSKSELKTFLPKPDIHNGQVIFQQTCSVCHGTNGQGGVAPPLWGSNSFNAGAGMANLKTMAMFVKNNMPASNPGSLSLQQAADVAAYVESQPRPPAPKS